jgi:hypothetical protein
MPGNYDTHVAPGFAVSARADLGKWLDPELVEHLIDGLRMAGLEIGPANTSSREGFHR